MTGSSQSNARVSAYLKELGKNKLFQDPQLAFVRTAKNTGKKDTVTATEPYQFSINVKLRPTKTADEEDGFDEDEDLGDAS